MKPRKLFNPETEDLAAYYMVGQHSPVHFVWAIQRHFGEVFSPSAVRHQDWGRLEIDGEELFIGVEGGDRVTVVEVD